MKNEKLLIVGGTGTVGRELVPLLLRQGRSLRLLVRDPAKAATLFGSEVEIAKGDLRDSSSLDRALSGVSAASLATSPSPGLFEEESNFVAAATRAQTPMVVKLSGFGIDFSIDRIHRAHAKSEAFLKASGVPFVILRPVVFMSNLMMDLGTIRKGRLPTARMSFVHPRDVAELLLHALTDTRHANSTWEFGGPEALTYDDVAALLSAVLRRSVRHVRLGATEFFEQAAASGLPDFVIEAITSAAVEAQAGKYMTDDPVVRRVLGRTAIPYRHWIVDNAGVFAA